MRIVKKHGAHYLQHSFRYKGKVCTREQYLGKKIPKDLESRKTSFLQMCRAESIFPRLQSITDTFHSEWKQMAPSAKDTFLTELSITLTYNSNKIEGSTITLEETRDIVERQRAPKKSINHAIETKRHATLFVELLNDSPPTEEHLLKTWHTVLFSETKPDIASTYREHLIRVGDYIAPEWQEVPQLMASFIKFLERSDLHPVELAARAHYKFEKIHPFSDGNGRIGRLLMNLILWERNYPPLVIEYTKRKSYYLAFQKDEEYFVKYFFRRYLNAHAHYAKEPQHS